MRISKKVVDNTHKSSKDTYIWDSELAGFGLKVTPKGRKVYLVQYRIGGRTRRVTLGAHGTITAQQARVTAKTVLGQAAAGIDPAAARDAAKSDHSFQTLFERFNETHISIKLKENSATDYRSLFKCHILPRFKNVTVQKVTKQDLLRLHHDLRKTPFRANRVISVLSKFFNWCEQHGYRPEHSNPTRFVQKYKEPARQRFLTSEEQYELGKALADAEQLGERDGGATPYAVAALRLLSLTGARLSEILTLQWQWVDLERGVLELPDSKTGKKTIYLNEAAKDVLREIDRQVDNPFVICGLVEGSHLINLQKPWRRIRSMAGLDDVRIHDLRHTFASVAVTNGMSLPIVGALLGHTQPQTTARYAHLAADPLLQAVEEIGQNMKI